MTSPSQTDLISGDLDLEPGDLDLIAAALTADLAPLAPAPSTRERLLQTGPSRFARFARTLADLIDVSVDRAKALLERALDLADPVRMASNAWEPLPIPGACTLWVEGGSAVAGCIRGFVRIPAGSDFPEHRHLGDEKVLVLDGAILDSSGLEYHPGDIAEMPAGSSHSYRARDGGTDLLVFAVVREGIDIGDLAFRHRDP
jgi:hypothetical protein